MVLSYPMKQWSKSWMTMTEPILFYPWWPEGPPSWGNRHIVTGCILYTADIIMCIYIYINTIIYISYVYLYIVYLVTYLFVYSFIIALDDLLNQNEMVNFWIWAWQKSPGKSSTTGCDRHDGGTDHRMNQSLRLEGFWRFLKRLRI